MPASLVANGCGKVPLGKIWEPDVLGISGWRMFATDIAKHPISSNLPGSNHPAPFRDCHHFPMAISCSYADSTEALNHSKKIQVGIRKLRYCILGQELRVSQSRDTWGPGQSLRRHRCVVGWYYCYSGFSKAKPPATTQQLLFCSLIPSWDAPFIQSHKSQPSGNSQVLSGHHLPLITRPLNPDCSQVSTQTSEPDATSEWSAPARVSLVRKNHHDMGPSCYPPTLLTVIFMRPTTKEDTPFRGSTPCPVVDHV